MFYLFDGNEKLIEIVSRSQVKEATREEEINSPDTLRVVFNSAFNKNAFYIGHKDVINENELCLYKIHSSKVSAEGWDITAIESAYDDLLADGYIKDYRPTNKTVKEVVTTIMNGSRWNLGNTYINKTINTNFYYLSRLESLQKIAELTQIEYKFRLIFDGQKVVSRYIDLYEKQGEDRGKRFVHGSRLLKVIKEEKNSGIYTALLGRGKGEEIIDEEGEATGGYGRRTTFADVTWSKSNGDPADKPFGQEFIEIPEMTAIFGYPDGKARIGLIEFEDIEDKEELLQITYDTLVQVSRPAISYTADVRDVGDTGLGDTVSIVRKDLGIAYKTRIYKREINLLNAADVTLELGDQVGNYQHERLQKLENIINQTQKENESIMQSVIKIAMNQYWGSDGYNYDFKVGNEYDLPAGMYSYDKPIDQNPSKVIYFGAGMLAIANSKKPDGSWNFTTFATGDGLIGDAIVTNSITANKLAADVGQELDISSNVAITSRVTKTEILTDPEIRDALKGEDGKPGDPGNKGADGQSVSKVTTQYYLSTSKTSVTGGSWGTALPAWKKNTYIWTRLKIDYINPTKTEYTTEVLDTVNNALNEVYNSGVILPSQKPQLLIKLAEIVEEYKALNTEDNQELDEWSAYESAYEILRESLDNITKNMTASTEINVTSFKAYNENYASAYADLQLLRDQLNRDELGDLEQRVTSAESKIEDGAIIDTVMNHEKFKEGVLDEISTFTQTTNDFTAKINKSMERLDGIENSDVMNYFTFTMDEEGNGYTELGSNIDGTKLRQYRDRISFMNGETELAYFANNAMNVDELNTIAINLGNYTIKARGKDILEFWWKES